MPEDPLPECGAKFRCEGWACCCRGAPFNAVVFKSDGKTVTCFVMKMKSLPHGLRELDAKGLKNCFVTSVDNANVVIHCTDARDYVVVSRLEPSEIAGLFAKK